MGALVMVGHLQVANVAQPRCGHAWPSHHALALLPQGRGHDDDAVDILRAALFEQKRDIERDDPLRAVDADERCARTADGGVDDLLGVLSAAGLPNTAAPSFARSTPCGPVVPGNAASILGSKAPPGPCSRWTSASASNTGTPSARSILATADLPMPIDPVSPSTIGRCR